MSEDEFQVVRVVNNREFIGRRIRDRGVSGTFTRPADEEDRVRKAEEEIRAASRPPPSFMRKGPAAAPPGGTVIRRVAENPTSDNGNPELKEKENLYIREEDKKHQGLQVVKVVKNEVSLESFPVSDTAGTREGPSEATLVLIRARLKRQYEDSAAKRGLVPGEGSQAGRISGTLVSRSTMEQYLRRGSMLFERWRLVTGAAPDNEEDADPVAWVNWLLSVKPSLKASTWRMYRQSVLHWLEGFPGQNTTEAMRLLETDITEGSRPEEVERRRKAARGRGGITGVTSVGEEGDEDDEDRTSALKEKRIPEDALEKIRMRLRLASRSRLAEALIDWLEAGVLTGLRPVEWAAVDMVVRSAPETEATPYGRMVLLYVINAKATNGRGTGVARTLDISRFSEREFGVVRRHAGRCRGWLESGRFTAVKGQCSTLLRNTVSALWPKGENGGIAEGRHYALYSCRHQAIANWKALNMPLEEIAAIVGHGVTSTTTERYGKRRSGWKPEKIPEPPRGIPEEVNMVRQRISMFHERLRQEKELGIKSSGPSEFTV